MASGSSGRGNSGKGFDFASDDILCSYDDYSKQEATNGNLSDPVIGSSSSKNDFQKSRMTRSPFPPAAYSQPDDSLHQDVISTVEITMKKHADNLMRFLEGISSRLSQLELYCYNLDKSIGEMRSELCRDHTESDTKLKSLEKHIQEVHRSVQILRDKQELAETQKELAKLQLVQKESTSSNHSQSEERASPAAADAKRNDNTSDIHNQQLALALPHQIVPQQQAAPPSQPPPQNVTQQQSYYLPPTQLPNPPAPGLGPGAAPTPTPAPATVPSQQPQSQYLPSDAQYRTNQMQDPTRVAPQPTSQVNPAASIHQYPPQFQQQWAQAQQLTQQVQTPQQPSLRPQIRPPPTSVYMPYPPNQSNPQPPQEMLPNSMPMQLPFSGVPQPASSRADAMPYGYGGPGRPVPQQAPPQQMKGNFGTQPGDGYAGPGSLSSLPPGSAYMMYDGEGGRAHHPIQQSHYPPGGYPPNYSQNPPPPTAGTNMMPRNPSPSQFVSNHPYSDLIEKLVGMGFRGDVVVNVIQRMEESGQPVDFNAVLDRLGPGGPQRGGWSG